MFYATMFDRFMSGWGKAEGKKNKFIVSCDTYEQAETICRNARTRDEMYNIRITTTKPRQRKGQLLTFKTYDQLGRMWKR